MSSGIFRTPALALLRSLFTAYMAGYAAERRSYKLAVTECKARATAAGAGQVEAGLGALERTAVSEIRLKAGSSSLRGSQEPARGPEKDKGIL